VVGDRVYATTAVTGFGGGKGRILCFHAGTGRLLWEAAPPGYRATFSSPVVAGDRLVCGEGLHFTRDARVVCLDLRSGHEGQVLWTYRTKSHVECTPVVYEGKVYVGAGDDGYYCFWLEGDGNGEAKVLWHLDGEDYPDAETSLAVHEGRVYGGLGWGGKAIFVLDAETGKELHRVSTDYPVFSPPAIADGRLYVGMGNGDYVHAAEELGMAPAGSVWCMDLQSNEVLWRYPVGRTVLGSPAVSDGRVYFGSRDGKLYCLDDDGSLIGAWDTYAPIVTSPAVTEHLAFVLSDSGVLYGLDRETLQPRWEFAVGSRPLLFSSPAIACGRVFVGTEHDGLLAVGEPGEWNDAEETPLWPGTVGGAGAAGNRDDSPLASLGAMHWQYPADRMGQTEEALVTAPPAAVEDDLIVPLGGGPKQMGLACLPADASGQETPTARWFCPTRLPVCGSPVVAGDTVLVVDGRPGDERRRLHAVDRATGEPLWRAPVAREASGALGCAEHEIFVQDAPRKVSCVSLTGERVWSQPVGPIDHAPTAVGALVLVAVARPSSLAVLDRPTGRELWRRELDARPTTAPAVSAQTVWVGTESRLEARSLVDGSRLGLWRCGGGGVSGEFFLGRDTLAYVSGNAELTLLARDDGELLCKRPGALRGFAPLPCRDRVFFLGGSGIMAIERDKAGTPGEPASWCDTSWLGPPTTSMVLANSNIYVGMAGWGLVRFGAE
jgi:outer membrane protein assembly factor BamB